MNTFIRLFQRLNRCDLYVLLWCIQGLNEVAYEPGLINKSCMLILLVWVLYEGGSYMLPLRSLPRLLRATSWFMLMFLVYGLILVVSPPSYAPITYEYSEYFLNSFGPIFLFYKYSKEGFLTEQRMRFYFFLITSCILWKYADAVFVRGGTEFTNNVGYELVALMPMIWLFKKQDLLRYVLWAIFMGLVLLSMKRGAILIGGSCFVWMLYASIVKSESKRSRHTAFLMVAVLSIGSIFFVQNMLENSEYFQSRVAETQKGGSSGRDKIYTMLWNHMVESTSYKDLLLGRGAVGTMELNKAAHQDWLSVAYENGFLGICLFVNFCWAFYHTSRQGRHYMSPYLATSFLMLCFVFLSKSMFSMSLQNITIGMSMLIGYYTFMTNPDTHNA